MVLVLLAKSIYLAFTGLPIGFVKGGLGQSLSLGGLTPSHGYSRLRQPSLAFIAPPLQKAQPKTKNQGMIVSRQSSWQVLHHYICIS